MLEIKGVDVFRAEVPVLRGVNLSVHENEIVALVGANGAGKSTLFETIFGFIHPIHGSIRFRAQDIHALAPHQIARLGIAFVPEGRRLFLDMTVLENIEIGTSILSDPKEKAKNLEFIFSLFPVLSDRLKQLAGTLSGGEQQMTSIGRALMLNPKLLIMDELSLGLSPKFTEEVFEAIRIIKNKGVGIILAEQNAALALEYSDRAYVLENGKVVQEGSSERLMNDPRVRSAYLGF